MKRPLWLPATVPAPNAVTSVSSPFAVPGSQGIDDRPQDPPPIRSTANCTPNESVPGRSKRSYLADLDELPNGVFVTWEENACLLWDDSLLLWSPGGYRERRPRPKGEQVAVLTPRSTVAVIRAGYVPEVHPSARTL